MQPGQDDPYNQQQPPTPPGSYPPPQAPYGDSSAQYGAPPPSYGTPPGAGGTPNNTQGLVGMILGIASIPLLCCLYLGLPVGIAAVIVSYMGLNKVKAGVATNRGQALAGLICGAVAIVLGIIGLIISIARGAWNFSTYSNL